jgi:hypothetical protein
MHASNAIPVTGANQSRRRIGTVAETRLVPTEKPKPERTDVYRFLFAFQGDKIRKLKKYGDSYYAMISCAQVSRREL